MKLKCRPEDFVVTERLCCTASAGAYSLYRLSKADIGTLEAIQHISRVWNLPVSRIAHAGLKDRHAITQQSITIRNGPQNDLRQDRFSLTYAGRTEKPVSAASLQANRFQIVARRMTAAQAANTVKLASDPGGFIVPNYFDEQRFGSLGFAGEYVAAAWCRRDYERATWLAMADPNRHDRSEEKVQKSILRDHWGDWSACKRQLSRSHRRSIVTYLVDHPHGFRKAFGLIRPDLRGIYLSAFQSAVWNRVLGQMIRQLQVGLAETTIADSKVPFGIVSPRLMTSLDQTVPLISARQRSLNDDQQQLADEATSHYGLQTDQMKVAYPRDRFFSRGSRRCWLSGIDVRAEASADELYPGYHSVSLDFELPPGCYATMLIRGLTDSSTNDHL
jgi:tRNA pseudouridine13 synthase